MKIRTGRWSALVSLAYRPLLLITAILMIPLVFQIVYVAPYLRNHEIQKEYDTQELNAELCSERVSNSIEAYATRLQNISQLPIVRQLDAHRLAEDLPVELDILEWLHAMAVFDETLAAIYSVAEPGYYEILTEYMSEVPLFSADAECGTARMAGEEQIVLPLCVPIPSTSFEEGGFLLGIVDLDEISTQLAEDNQLAARNVYLVDQHGRLLASNTKEEMSSLDDLTAHPAVMHFLEREAHAQTHHHILEDNQILATHVELTEVPWAVVVETPLAEIISRSSTLGQQILAMNAGILGILLVLAWGVVVWIAKERIRYEHRLHTAARRDGLTGLRNRFALEESIPQEEVRAKRYGHPLGVLMIDVNRFKEVNDRFGHQMGDKVLQVVSAILQKNVRETDIVFRYGGDEFLILLPETNGETEIVRLRIQEEVSKRNESNPLLEFPVTLAIGSVHWEPSMNVSLEQIIEQADVKMYDDKRERGAD